MGPWWGHGGWMGEMGHDFNRYCIFNEKTCSAERPSCLAVIAPARRYLESVELELLWGGCRCGMQHCT